MDRQKKDKLPKMQCDFIINICSPIYEVSCEFSCLYSFTFHDYIIKMQLTYYIIFAICSFSFILMFLILSFKISMPK